MSIFLVSTTLQQTSYYLTFKHYNLENYNLRFAVNVLRKNPIVSCPYVKDIRRYLMGIARIFLHEIFGQLEKVIICSHIRFEFPKCQSEYRQCYNCRLFPIIAPLRFVGPISTKLFFFCCGLEWEEAQLS